ncbi:MAG: Uma2 family endonuclease [Deltaproteobacteria bacterium]|nr:Uma2 family endonuclease [Deltaproteobacteria bacterium]
MAARRRATYADLLKVPDLLVAEILEGELITTPRPAVPHALAASAIGSALFDGFNRPPGGAGKPGGWWVLYEPELHLGEDVLVPDVAGWRRDRMPTCPTGAAIDLAPDWACEVLSPTTARIDRGQKMRIYAREAVGHLWLVDPIARTLEIYRLEHGRWVPAVTHGGTQPIHAAPFAAVALEIGRWWGED